MKVRKGIKINNNYQKENSISNKDILIGLIIGSVITILLIVFIGNANVCQNINNLGEEKNYSAEYGQGYNYMIDSSPINNLEIKDINIKSLEEKLK